MNIEVVQERILLLRREHNWTQQNLSDKLKIGQATYSDYEKGRHRIPLKVYLELARLYQTSVDYLVGNTDVKERKKHSESIDSEEMGYKNRIAWFRTQNHKTKADMGRILKVSPKTYTRYEDQKVQLPIECAVILARLYEISLDCLLGWTKDSTPYPPTEDQK